MYMNKGNRKDWLFNMLTAIEMNINPRLVYDKLSTGTIILYINY